MRIIAIAFLLVAFYGCAKSQTGGLGFWNDHSSAPPAPGDSVDVMYDGFFLASKEGAEEYVYSIPKNYPVLLKYKVRPNAGKGFVVAGAFTGSEFTNPTEVKHVGGHLFVLDRGGTRITRINMGNFSDKTVVFDAPLTPYPFFSFTPLLDPGQPIGTAKIFGLYFNQPQTGYTQLTDSLVSGGFSVRDWVLIGEATSINWVRLRTGTPLYSVPFPTYSTLDASISAVTYGGTARLVTIKNISTTSGYAGGAYILDSDELRYGNVGTIDNNKVTISSLSGPFLSNHEILLPLSPVVAIGNTFGVVSTAILDGYGQFTAIKWIDNTITNSLIFNSTYWSGIINSDETAVYYIMKTDNPGNLKTLFKQAKNGTTTTIRAVYQ